MNLKESKARRGKRISHRERLWRGTTVNESGLRQLTTLDGDLVQGTPAWDEYWVEIDRLDAQDLDNLANAKKRKRQRQRKKSLRASIMQNAAINENGMRCLATLDGIVEEGTPEWKSFWSGIRTVSSQQRRLRAERSGPVQTAMPTFDSLD